MDFSGVSLKEFVEMIEARIPGGKWVTTVILSLLVIVLAVFCVRYLGENAVLPLVVILRGWLSGTKVTFSVGIAAAIMAWALSFVGLFFLKRLLDKMLAVNERTLRHAEGTGRDLDEIGKGMVETIGRVQDLSKALLVHEQRISMLEKKHTLAD